MGTRKRKIVKRRSSHAKALQSPLYRQRRKPSAKRYRRGTVHIDIETRSGSVAEHAMMCAVLDSDGVSLHDMLESF